ncbi:Arm DNA-binding domain-containing protein [Caballeronia glebae]|uniref:Arm DNA-binding domain-containing protein n=1 Tax=Caballeronia glebae TaxID=1777143 RepID=UPI00389913FA
MPPDISPSSTLPHATLRARKPGACGQRGHVSRRHTCERQVLAHKVPVRGKEKRLALGVYPDVTPAAARKKRDDAREKLAHGFDPGGAKKVDKRAALRSLTISGRPTTGQNSARNGAR